MFECGIVFFLVSLSACTFTRLKIPSALSSKHPQRAHKKTTGVAASLYAATAPAGVRAVLFDKNAMEAGAYAAALADPAERDRRGQAGAARARAEFSRAAVVDAHLAIYERLLAERGPRRPT